LTLLNKTSQVYHIIARGWCAENDITTRNAPKPCRQPFIKQCIASRRKHTLEHADIDHGSVYLKVSWRIHKKRLRADTVEQEVKRPITILMR
jgi:hypothetical protein